MKSLSFKVTLIIFIFSSTNAFGMERLKNILVQLNLQKPALTKENIKKYPELKEYFIKEVEENILKYTETINQIMILQELFEVYKKDVAKRLAIPAVKHFDKVMNSGVIELILSHYEEAARYFIDPAFKNFNDLYGFTIMHILVHCIDALDMFNKLLLENFEAKITKDEHNQYATNILLIYMISNKINSENIGLLIPKFIPKIINHYDKITCEAWHIGLVNANKTHYKELAEKTLLCTNKSFYILETKLEFFLRILNIFKKNDKEASDTVSGTAHSIVYEDEVNFDKNHKIYLELFDYIKNEAIENPNKYPLENLDIFYTYLSIDEQEKLKKNLNRKEEFKPTVAWAIKNLPNLKLLKHLSENSKIVTSAENSLQISGQETPTKHHVFSNLKTVHQMVSSNEGYIKNKEKFQDPRVQEFLLNIYKKEKEERAKGNYFFYHGRNKHIRFSGEIYKQLWKLKNGAILTAEWERKFDNFIFMRFESQNKANHQRDDFLFMNHSLFGNAHETTGASTLTGYWLRDHSAHFVSNVSNERFSTKNLFAMPEFKLTKYFKKYETELKQLQELHNVTETGEIVAISIPKDKVQKLVTPCTPGGYTAMVEINGISSNDSIKILEALSYDANSVKICSIHDLILVDRKSSDYLEWKIPLENSYALDPIYGPDFYSFYFMDAQSKKEYEDKRNQLFAKIKRDYERDLIKEAKESKKLKQMQTAMSISSCL